MKAPALLFLLLAAVLLAGCESDMPPDNSRGNPIQRGLKGEGTLVQPDQTDSANSDTPTSGSPTLN